MEKEDINAEILKLQQDLIILRELFYELANKKIAKKTRERLENLDKFVPKNEVYDLPQFSLDVNENSEVEVTKLRDFLKKEIKLIQILVQKLDCPISQIIDAI